MAVRLSALSAGRRRGRNKKNSVAFSLQANYTDWATAIGRRILVPIFVDREVSCGRRGGTPKAVNPFILVF
jgi:hypothetical protein